MKLLIIGILSSIFISCGNEITESTYFKTYSYVNDSGHSIVIEKFSNGNKITYDLPKSTIINFQLELNSGDCLINEERMSSVVGGCLLVFADSLKIIFDDSRTLIYKLEDTREINIFNENNYEYSKNGNHEFFNYSFTDKDYLEAN